MASQMKLLLVTSSLEEAVPQSTQAQGSDAAADNDAANHVTPALLPVAGVPLISHWISAASKCPRLLPLEQKVFVVCNDSSRAEFTDWANRSTSPSLPAGNIISNGPAGSGRGPLDDIALFLQTVPMQNEHLVVVQADNIMEPDFNLSRVLEAAVIRAKDTITYTTPFGGEDMSELIALRLDQSGSSSSTTSRVVEVLPGAAAGGDDCSTSTTAPLYIFRSSTLPELTAAARQGWPAQQQMGRLLQGLLRDRPVYAVHVDLYFLIGSADTYHLTDAFFQYCERQQRRQAGASATAKADVAGLANESLIARLQSYGVKGTLPPAAEHAPDIRQMFSAFYASYTENGTQSLLPEAKYSEETLPVRFKDVSTWKSKHKQQHPVYMTSNADYGAKLPTQADMPPIWTGLDGRFTNAFRGPYRTMGLKTAVARSKVHRALDQL